MRKNKLINRLNWNGFLIVYLLSVVAVISNKNISSQFDAIIIGQIVGLFFGVCFLFIGMSPKDKPEQKSNKEKKLRVFLNGRWNTIQFIPPENENKWIDPMFKKHKPVKITELEMVMNAITKIDLNDEEVI